MRTAVYIRVSTEDQAREGFSIPAQREKLLSYVHSQDWTLSKLYVDEGVSAKDTNRPALAELLQDVRSGKIDVVLVYRLDRLTRSVLDLYQLLQEFERYRVHFKSCTEVYDTTTAMGRLFITLVAALAQWERENLAERVKLGMEQMVKERKRPGGPPPYGYVLVDGALQLHPGEAGTVRTMFEQYLQGASPRRIAEQANSLGARGKMEPPGAQVPFYACSKIQSTMGRCVGIMLTLPSVKIPLRIGYSRNPHIRQSSMSIPFFRSSKRSATGALGILASSHPLFYTPACFTAPTAALPCAERRHARRQMQGIKTHTSTTFVPPSTMPPAPLSPFARIGWRRPSCSSSCSIRKNLGKQLRLSNRQKAAASSKSRHTKKKRSRKSESAGKMLMRMA